MLILLIYQSVLSSIFSTRENCLASMCSSSCCILCAKNDVYGVQIQMYGTVRSEVTDSRHSNLCSGPAVYHSGMVTFGFAEYNSNAGQ